MTHIMLDLETWGTRPGCDIRSIGATVFDPVTGTVGVDPYTDIFYLPTSNPIQGRYGGPKETVDSIYCNGVYRNYDLHRDPKTVDWWNNQSPEAQAAFDNSVDLRYALALFAEWFVDFDNGNYESTDIKIWANDPHFDVSILEAAYHAVGLSEPWHYRAPRSMKTATDLAGLTRDEYVTSTVAHHALHDAIAQATTVCKCYERLGLTK